MNGDQSLFTRSDAIERLWEISAPLLTPRRPSRSPAEGASMIKPDLGTERLGGAQAQPELPHHSIHPRR